MVMTSVRSYSAHVDEYDINRSDPVSHGDNEPVLIGFDIEDNTIVRQETRAGILAFDILRRFPNRLLLHRATLSVAVLNPGTFSKKQSGFFSL